MIILFGLILALSVYTCINDFTVMDFVTTANEGITEQSNSILGFVFYYSSFPLIFCNLFNIKKQGFRIIMILQKFLQVQVSLLLKGPRHVFSIAAYHGISLQVVGAAFSGE